MPTVPELIFRLDPKLAVMLQVVMLQPCGWLETAPDVSSHVLYSTHT